jgi:hypothetical protein
MQRTYDLIYFAQCPPRFNQFSSSEHDLRTAFLSAVLKSSELSPATPNPGGDEGWVAWEGFVRLSEIARVPSGSTCA